MKIKTVIWFMLLVVFFILIHPAVKIRVNDAISEYPYVFILAFLVSTLLCPLLGLLARELGAIDEPDPRKIHATATPLLGGVAIFTGIIFTLAWNYELSSGLRTIFVSSTLVMAAGLLDDFFEISAKVRLVVQVIAAGILIHSGIRLTFLPDAVWGDIGEIVLTVVWMVGITNAFNFFDGMDGLAAGLAFISTMTFFIISMDIADSTLAHLSLAIAAATLGFLQFNFHPAKIFMGDGGSNFLGFMLAAMAIYGSWSDADPLISFSIPLMILSPLVFDMIYITVDRINRGDVTSVREWLEYTGQDHFHHRVKAIGLSTVTTVLFLYLISGIVCIGAILIRDLEIRNALFVIMQSVIIYLVVVVLMLLSKEAVEEKSYLTERIKDLKLRINTKKQMKSKELKKDIESETLGIARQLIDDIEQGRL